MSEQKTSRYLKYAVGEIILVVIGILIALWINSTFNNYKEKQVETTVLKKLIADIEADYDQLLYADSLNQIYLQKMMTFKKAMVSNNEDVIKTMIDQQYGGAQFLDINPRSTTFDEMINSGKLYTLSNSELTDVCINYYEIIDKYSNSLLQNRKEYRALFYGPQMTDYWLIYLEETKNKNEYIDAFITDKQTTAYKTLKQCTGWGEMIMENNGERLEFINNLIEVSATK